MTWASRFCSIDVDPLVPLDERGDLVGDGQGADAGSTRSAMPSSRSWSRASTSAQWVPP